MSYRIPVGAVVHEIPKIKGSRFIGSVQHVASEQEARAHLERTRKAEHAARHHCWAWRLGEDGSTTRSSDAGEPSGSAGKPILAAIHGADLTFVSVVVTRYFGGTKLGVGGLVRAYGDAAAAALAACQVQTIVPTLDVVVGVPYDQLGLFEAFVAREGRERPEAEYGDGVSFTFAVPVDEAAPFAARVIDASSGRITAKLKDE